MRSLDVPASYIYVSRDQAREEGLLSYPYGCISTSLNRTRRRKSDSGLVKAALTWREGNDCYAGKDGLNRVVTVGLEDSIQPKEFGQIDDTDPRLELHR